MSASGQRDLDSRRYAFVRDHPTRARSVLAHITYAEATYVEGRKRWNRQARRAERKYKPKPQGHPTRIARGTAKQRRGDWFSPSQDEKAIREINRLVRAQQQAASKEDGPLAGLLSVAARFATPHLLNDFDLDPAEHTAPFELWLIARFGDVLRYPDPDGYLAWRQQSRDRVARDQLAADDHPVG